MQSCLMILFSFSLCPTVIVPKLKKNSQSVQKPPWLRSEQAAWLSWVITVCHIANGMKRIFPYSYYNSKSFAMLKQFDEIFADIQKSTFRFPHFFFWLHCWLRVLKPSQGVHSGVSNSEPPITSGWGYLCCSLKSTVSSLLLLIFSRRWFCWHKSSRWETSLL